MAKSTKQGIDQVTTEDKSSAIAELLPTEKVSTIVDILRVSELARAGNVPGWEVAALRQATGWAPGKQVTKAQFAEGLTKLRNRPQGGGRI